MYVQNERDYTLLLAVPCGVNHPDITEQTRNLSIGFIDYLRSKQAAGIVNVSQPDSNQVPWSRQQIRPRVLCRKKIS
jgi:hypothetical protein